MVAVISHFRVRDACKKVARARWVPRVGLRSAALRKHYMKHALLLCFTTDDSKLYMRMFKKP